MGELEISIQYASYQKRVFDLLFSSGTFLLLIIIPLSFISVSTILGYGLILFAIYYCFVILIESRMYIIEIDDNEEYFIFKYYWYNKGPFIKSIMIDSASIIWFDAVKGNINASHLDIEGKSSKIRQSAVGHWKRNTIEEVCFKLIVVQRNRQKNK